MINAGYLKDSLALLLYTVIAFVIVALILSGFYSFGYLLPADWKVRYVAMYQVSASNVAIEEKPKLCDWGRAPIGDKGCHYEAVVHLTRWNTSTAGKPIVSYDNGKTWELVTSSEDIPVSARKLPSTFVVISWDKREDGGGQ